ncbi:acid protease [Rickenella mellea]|uniref:Acid protease n=1 Tax=Rickenella mellea TaxID=50990 RepID=A0A4Y7Q721_9AGAM|nr:acid protease [Rickenella mellea]
MKVAVLPLLLLFVSLDAMLSNAIKFPMHARSRAFGLARRMDMSGGSAVLQNSGDISYFCNISLGGVQQTVLIDTGSSDLYVTKNVTDSKVLNVHAEVAYAGGSASGPISLATFTFDHFRVPDQAYIQATNFTEMPVDGIIGLGPSANSLVRLNLGNSTGDPPLDRIFQQNMTTPNFISILLDRKADDDAGTSDPLDHAGQLTIGEIIHGLEAVNNQPRLMALKDGGTGRPAHWATNLDPEGVIGPDGHSISVSSAVPTNNSTNLLQVVFDSGFSLPQVPKEVADGIYGRIPGSYFVPQGDIGVWAYPCDYELNVSFKFGGVSYPVHPLDLGIPAPEYEMDAQNLVLPVQESDSNTCIATFQQRFDNFINFTNVDMILGMPFMRNTYTLINFGDFVDGSSTSVADAYIQLLSITNVTDAHSDFVKIRLGGVDTTGTQALLLPAGATQSKLETTILSPDGAKHIKKLAKKTLWVIIALAALAVLGCAIFCSLMICLVKRLRRTRSGPGERSVPSVPGMSSYNPLLPGKGDHNPTEPSTLGVGYRGYQEPDYQYGHA